MPKQNHYFEVQFKDGLGAWRRWSRSTDESRSQASLRRLREFIGTFPGSDAMSRITKYDRHF
jgi:hypothetical protein